MESLGKLKKKKWLQTKRKLISNKCREKFLNSYKLKIVVMEKLFDFPIFPSNNLLDKELFQFFVISLLWS